jgi:hypothetical protein
MNKTVQLETSPPVNIKLWEKSKRYFWAYDYDGCPKNGPFNSQQLALTDANIYSTK